MTFEAIGFSHYLLGLGNLIPVYLSTGLWKFATGE
jgi:hypothetical protein